MLNIVLTGPPGSGKSVQSEMLQEKYGLLHLSTGNICRQEIKKKTSEGLLIRKLIDNGNFFPDHLAYRMVGKFLDANGNARGFVYDGFPRSMAQMSEFAGMLQKRGSKISIVIELDVEGEELIKRLLARGESSGRADDVGREIIENRLQIYKDITVPVIRYSREKGIYQNINGMGSKEEVFAKICESVDRIINIS